ncbi:hypothetical protein RhiJN_02870 [Ceratobasidium sp. AG-Ba]|nr:hypothetical protein RhiJN_02870 [Ceratobasidium sp. AG-Ba]
MDKSVLRAFDPLAAAGKENTSINPAFSTPTAKSTNTGKNALSLSGFFNRYAHPRPKLQPTKLQDDLLVDVEDIDEKKRSVLGASLLGGDFAGGVRRESFPGKHANVPDVSFNIERVDEEGSIDDRMHLSELTCTKQTQGMSFTTESNTTPMPIMMRSVSAPTPQRPVFESDDNLDTAYTIRMIPAPISPTRAKGEEFPLASPPRVSAVDSSPVAAFKARTVPTWGPPPMRSASPTRIPSPTRRNPSPTRRNPSPTRPFPSDNATSSSSFPKLKLDLGQGFEFALSENENRTPVTSPPGPNTIASRAAAMRFVSAEQTMLEDDSIMDVQLPNLKEDEGTIGFFWSKSGKDKPETMSTISRKVSVSSRIREEPVVKPRPKSEIRAPSSFMYKDPEPSSAREPFVDPALLPLPRSRCNSAASNPAADTTTSTIPEDEPTLNISALGLGNTLLIDTSLEQLKFQAGVHGLADGTFGGASFAREYPSDDERPKKQFLDVRTPKVTRTMSSTSPDHESTDLDADVEATVKKPRPAKGRVVSDAVVNELRSGKALHRGSSSISSVGPHKRRESEAAEYLPNNLHHSQGSVRSQSRASSVVDDARPGSTLSRPSSRLSLVYASSKLPSYAERPSSVASLHYDRPSSVASVYDRPTSRPSSVASIRPPSAASVRPSSVASIRPPSVASTRTTSTRPESAASERPPSTTSTSAPRQLMSPSESLRHLARGMEEDVRKEMQAFMIDDMEEYMRSEDDACSPRAQLQSLGKTKSVPATTLGGSAPRVRPRTSMLPPAAPPAKPGSKLSGASTGTRIGAPRNVVPKSTSGARSTSLGLASGAKAAPSAGSTRSASGTIGSKSSAIAPKPSSIAPKPSSGVPKPPASVTAPRPASGSLRGRSSLTSGSTASTAPAPSLRGTRPPAAPSATASKTLRPRTSSSSLVGPKPAEEEPRKPRPAASTISGRGPSKPTAGSSTPKPASASLSRAGSSQMTPGSVASLRRR